MAHSQISLRAPSTEEVLVGRRQIFGTEIVELKKRLGALHPGLLRSNDFCKKRILRMLGDHLIPDLQLLLDDRGTGLDDIDTALPDFIEIPGIPGVGIPGLVA